MQRCALSQKYNAFRTENRGNRAVQFLGIHQTNR